MRGSAGLSAREEIKTSIPQCPRCGERHGEMVFSRLDRPVYFAARDVVWSHWAPCPELTEPIILRLEATGTTSSDC